MRDLALVFAIVSSAASGAVAQVPQHQPAPSSQLQLLPVQTGATSPSELEPPPSEYEPPPSEFEPPPAALLPSVLAPLPRPTESRYRWPLWRTLTGSVLLVGGGILIGFGGSALSVDGVCVPTPPPGVLACRRYYDTKDKGTALVTSGVLTAIGGVLFATIPSRKSRPKLSIQLLLPSLGVAASSGL
ncbi:MAG: hypothetical protein JNM83_06685 [Myxococcales bacterium]|nr:hypothetical protein [Myxococcales bacterium]